MTKTKSISILGCGWLGLPLAKAFVQKKWHVRGSTTHADKLPLLKENHIEPYLIRVSPDQHDDMDAAFFDSEVFIINIPPGRKNPDVAKRYPQQMQSVARAAAHGNVKKILFVSSTSVYPNLNREVTEDDAHMPDKENGRAVWQAEQVFLNHPNFQTTIVRFCGLYGPERNPGRFLAGKTLKTSGDAGVNLIHLQDCLAIIIRLVEEGVWGEVFNACADAHPSKSTYYQKVAREAGLDAPVFTHEEPESFKLVNSHKLKKRLNYQFVHPDPLKST